MSGVYANKRLAHLAVPVPRAAGHVSAMAPADPFRSLDRPASLKSAGYYAAGHANGICGTYGRDDHMVSHTLANPNAAGSIAPQHQRRSSQSALFYAIR